MTAENGIIDAEWHPNAQYQRYRSGNAHRGRTLPHDSIFYRPVHDVPPVPASDAILDWCMANWERPYLNVGVGGWQEHDAAADTPSNTALPRPGWYLDEAPVVPTKRSIEMSNANNAYLSTSPTQMTTTFPFVRFAVDFFPARTERRVKEGHARSQYNFFNPSAVRPFHPVDGDRPVLTVWPSLQMTTETTNTDWSGIVKDARVGSYVQRSFNINDWPYYWDNRKPGNRGSYAGASSSLIPIPSLMVTYEELARGWINHTIMMAVQSYSSGGSPENQPGYSHWPSIQSDGLDAFAPGALEAGGPFGGHIFRLKASFDIKGFTDNPLKRTLLRGLRDHGMILMDRHGSSFAGNPRPENENRPVNVLVADHAKFEPHPEWDDPEMAFGTGTRSSYTPGAMGPLVFGPGALLVSKEYWEVISLRNYQKLEPGRARSSTYPAVDEYGNPVVNQDHWQCIMPGAA